MSLSSINRVVLIGNLTRDPELRALAKSGTSVCHLRVACNGRRKTDTGWVNRAHYFDVSVFGPHAENSSRFLRKGKPVAIDGRLEWSEWESGGQKRQSVSIIADTVQFLGRPEPRTDPAAETGDEASGAQRNGEVNGASVAPAAPAAAEVPDAPLEPVGAVGSDDSDDSDDLRF